MNLDNIMAWSSLIDKENLSKEVELQNPFSGSLFYGENSKVSYILMGPWHSGSYIFSPMKRKIQKLGLAYVQYNLIPDILSPDVNATRSYFEIVSQNVRKDLEKLNKENGIERFVMVGLSLSCVFAMMISNNNKLISDIILVAPGNSLAESFWSSLRTIRVKRVMKKSGITLKYLKRYWLELAPEHYVDGVKDKKIKIILGRKDLIIPFRFGKKLAREIKQHIPSAEIIQNKSLGHYGTIISFLLSNKYLHL